MDITKKFEYEFLKTVSNLIENAYYGVSLFKDFKYMHLRNYMYLLLKECKEQLSNFNNENV